MPATGCPTRAASPQKWRGSATTLSDDPESMSPGPPAMQSSQERQQYLLRPHQGRDEMARWSTLVIAARREDGQTPHIRLWRARIPDWSCGAICLLWKLRPNDGRSAD